MVGCISSHDLSQISRYFKSDFKSQAIGQVTCSSHEIPILQVIFQVFKSDLPITAKNSFRSRRSCRAWVYLDSEFRKQWKPAAINFPVLQRVNLVVGNHIRKIIVHFECSMTFRDAVGRYACLGAGFLRHDFKSHPESPASTKTTGSKGSASASTSIVKVNQKYVLYEKNEERTLHWKSIK